MDPKLKGQWQKMMKAVKAGKNSFNEVKSVYGTIHASQKQLTATQKDNDGNTLYVHRCMQYTRAYVRAYIRTCTYAENGSMLCVWCYVNTPVEKRIYACVIDCVCIFYMHIVIF